MALDIDPPDRVPSEAEIQDLERQLGFRLPDRFRALLPQLNGAVAEPNVIEGPRDEDYAINRFEKIEDIVDSKNAIDSVRPSDLSLVPFARDDCGDWFCVVAADGAETGAVYFVDHEIAGNEAFSKVAASLDELIENAEPYVDTDEGGSTGIVVYAEPGFLEFCKEQERERQKKQKERMEGMNSPGFRGSSSPVRPPSANSSVQASAVNGTSPRQGGSRLRMELP